MSSALLQNGTDVWDCGDLTIPMREKPQGIRGCPRAVPIMDFERPHPLDGQELIKHRFLCRGGGLLLVGPTGVGKSSLSMQIMISFALGRDALGLSPIGPLKSLMIQAENDDGDLAEFRDGTLAGLGLGSEELTSVADKVLIATVDDLRGEDFFAVVAQLLREHRPDLLWIDPAFAYLDGDSNSSRDVGGFLRAGLNPLIHEFGCGLVLIHHTPKPYRISQGGNPSPQDFAYSGAGSAEFANWSRATLTLEPFADAVFKLHARKRQSRLRWRNGAGDPASYQLISHSHLEGRILWSLATEEEAALAPVKGKPRPTLESLLALLPAVGSIETKVLQKAAREAGINEKRFPTLRDEALEKQVIFKWELPRVGARAAVHYSRRAQDTPTGAATCEL